MLFTFSDYFVHILYTNKDFFRQEMHVVSNYSLVLSFYLTMRLGLQYFYFLTCLPQLQPVLPCRGLTPSPAVYNVE